MQATPRYFENDNGTGRAVRVETWGFSVSTIAGDAGVSLGRRERTYYLPGPASGAFADAGDESGETGKVLRPATAFEWQSRTPLAVTGATEGFGLDAGWAGAGLVVGVRRFEAVRPPPGRAVRLIFKTRGGGPAGDIFHVREGLR